FGLDTFSGDGDAELDPKPDHRAHDRRRVAFVEVADERAVYLDLVDRKAPEIAERGIAGAEIVERDANAELAQLAERPQHAIALVHHHRLGDFELQPVGRHAGKGKRRDHAAGETAALD